MKLNIEKLLQNQGYQGTLNEMLSDWLKSNANLTELSLNKMWLSLISDQGYSNNSWNERVYFWLKGKGYSGLSLKMLSTYFTIDNSFSLSNSTAVAIIKVRNIREWEAFSKDPKSNVYDMGMSPTDSYAPFHVFFEGWESTGSISEYFWDFGDGSESDVGGRYATGQCVAHVYEKPGIYQATLKVYDGKAKKWSALNTIEISVRNGNAGKIYYIDSEIGDDNLYDGTSPTVKANGVGPWKTATKAFSGMKRPSKAAPINEWIYQPGDSIKFKRGQTFKVQEVSKGFTVHSPYNSYGTGGYFFGTYGTGNKPVIIWDGGKGGIKSRGIFFGMMGTQYVSFVDLDFRFENNGYYGAEFLTVVSRKILNWACLRCSFSGSANSYFSVTGNYSNVTTSSISGVPQNMAFVGCDFSMPEDGSVEADIAFIRHAAKLTWMHNSIQNKYGAHQIYAGMIDRGYVSNNMFGPAAFGSVCLRISGGILPDRAQFIQISDNNFGGWKDDIDWGNKLPHNGRGKRYNFLSVDFTNNNPKTSKWKNNITFERNVIMNSEQSIAVNSASNVLIRHNLIWGWSKTSGYRMTIAGSSPGYPVKNIRVVNNTFFTTMRGNAKHKHSFFRTSVYKGKPERLGKGASLKEAQEIIGLPWKNQNIEIKNNIFYFHEDGTNSHSNFIKVHNFKRSSDLKFLDIENNIYRTPSGWGSWNGTAWLRTFSDENKKLGQYSYTEWKSLTGNDAKSKYTEGTNPGFKSIPTNPNHLPGEPANNIKIVAEINQVVDNLKLSQNGIAKGNGIDLYYYVFDDYNQIIWDPKNMDIGAYKYSNE